MVNWLDRLNPQAGGAETHLHEIFGRLAGWGHQVTVLASGFPDAAPRETVDGMEVHRVGGRMTFGLFAPRKARALLAGGDYHVMVEDLNKVPVFSPLWGPEPVPVVLLVHHLFGSTAFQEASLPVAAATWLLEQPVPRVFDRTPVVSVSDSTARDLIARGLPSERIQVIPNGVDLQALTPAPSGHRFPDPTVLYLGRLKRYKRVDLILKAMVGLKRRIPGVRCLVAGKGDHGPDLEAAARRLGLGDSVRFLGYVSEGEKVELYRRSWVHVLTSPKEGWGISILEAAACGTPSVASDSPGLRDAVRHGETGVLVSHGDVEALSETLAALLEQREELESMGRKARSYAEEFSWDASARRMEQFLEARVAAGPVVS